MAGFGRCGGGLVCCSTGGPGVYRDMEQWLEIRRQVLVEGVSKRQILRETGMHWKTLEKILQHSRPPGYRRLKPPAKPKLGPHLDWIAAILEADKSLPRKQRHTAKRIWQRLQEEGFDGGYTIVKDAVRELKRRGQEVFVPLVHRPGEAQVDFGHALVKVSGQLRKVVFFVMVLPYSDAFFIMAFERECTETFWEGHVRAFAYFGGVPIRISYDNSKVMVSQIVGTRKRRLTPGFAQLVSHYLFDYHFCLVRRANEKGVVEGVVKFARLNFFVPVPQVRDLDELNAYLLEACGADLQRRLRGQGQAKAELLTQERSSLRALPDAPFDACRVQSARATSESLVRFDNNDYSVPVEYAHHPVTVRGFFDRVVIGYQEKVIAVHRRCWDKEQFIFEPIHYLPLLERKPGALAHARPLEDWFLPPCFEVLQHRLEQELGGRGTYEYIRVLRLQERHPKRDLERAVVKGLEHRVHSRDGIAQFIPPPEPWSLTTFKLDGREHLRHVKVAATDLDAYQSLLVGGGVT
jgi:transposase